MTQHNIPNNIRGFSLLEIAILMLLISIMMIPVIKNFTVTSGRNSDSQSALSLTQTLLTEEHVAKSIMEKALANDPNYHPLVGKQGSTYIQLGFNRVNGALSVYDVNSYDASTNTDSATPYTHSKREYGDADGMSTGIYFMWEVEDEAYDYSTSVSGNPSQLATPLIPVGNQLVKGVLNVYSGKDAATATTPSYRLSSHFFRNDTDAINNNNIFDDKVGVVLVLDTSSSMKWAQKEADVYGAQEGYCSTYSSSAYGAVFDFGQQTFCPSGVSYVNEPHYTGASEPWTAAGFTTGSSVYNLPNKSATGQTPLPIRTSSGVAYKYQTASIGVNGLYDSLAVASPYLVYRSTDDSRTAYDDREDLYFGGLSSDDPTTVYNEAYNPCASSSSSYFPSGKCIVSITTKDHFKIANSEVPRASGTSDYIFVDLYESSKAAAILPSSGGSYSGPAQAFNVNAFDPTSNDPNCFYSGQNQPFSIGMSYCAAVYADGAPAPVSGTFISALGPEQLSNYRLELLASQGAPQTVEWTLSRLESGRTAMLAFTHKIENSSELKSNFKIGVVTYSSAIGTTVSLESIDGSDKFANVDATLKRVNRACRLSSGGSSYLPACPSDQAPIVPTAGTNISNALTTAQTMLNADSDLATRIIILLTDGKPDSTDSNSSFRSGDIAGIKTFADAISSNNGMYDDEDDIIIYSIGLLVGGDSQAVNTLKTIADPTPAESKGEAFFTESVGSLTPIFEAIARQAELFALNNIRKRYNNINLQ